MNPGMLLFRQALQGLFIVVSLLGAFSLNRIDSRFEWLGLLSEPRVLVCGIACGLALLCRAAARSGLRMIATEWCAVLLFAAAHALLLASALWTESGWTLERQLPELCILVASVVAYRWLFRGEPERSIRLMLACSLLLAMALLVVGSVLSGGVGSDAIGALGAGGIGASRLFGVAMIASVCYCIGSGRLLMLVFVPVLLAGIMMSGSRAALLALLPALAFIWIRRKAMARRRFSVAAVLSALLLGLASLTAFFLSPFGMEIATNFIASNFVSVSSSGQASSGLYLADRDVIFGHAVREFLLHPLVGLGIGSYRGPFGEEYPHNLFLLYAVDGGVGPLLLLALFSFLVGRALWRARSDWAVGCGAIVIFVWVASLFAGSYYDARLFWFCGFALLTTEARQRSRWLVSGGLLTRDAHRDGPPAVGAHAAPDR